MVPFDSSREKREFQRVRHWNERNRLAMEQSRLKLSRPLDEQRLLERLREKLAKVGIQEHH
jgi:hypothetical protein